jgi:deaminated glutathione amidase
MKVAAIQMCSSNEVDENLEVAAGLIQSAALDGAKLVVLPEGFSIIGSNEHDKLAVKEIYGSGKVQEFLSQQALKNNIWIVGGTMPIRCENPQKVRAACIVYDNKGKPVGRYDKMHLFDAVISEFESYKESNTIEAGDKVVVIETPVGRLGIAVCYDIRFPMMFTRLFDRGAEIIAIPAAFTMRTGEAHWQLLARSRAVENFCYVIGACQGGTHASNRKTYGHSLIIDPWGSVLAERTEPGPGVIYSDISLEKIYKIRAAMPSLSAHKKNCYCGK